jgi:4-amino-4-deoxy-L-arabinose transferase-like glycosyltransferase
MKAAVRQRRGQPRAIRTSSYAILLALFASIVIPSHLWLVRLPYYWDEAGQFVPSALDILRGGHLIPRSIVPNIHPPMVFAYLAGAWRMFGFAPAVTHTAMLVLASFGVLAAFLLAIELSHEARGAPAFLAAALLCVSPVFFVESSLAQLDAPAMLFTTLALLFFLEDRIRLAAAACVALVLTKETGMVAPLVFAAWLARERRWRDAAWFVLPAAALAAWIGVLSHATGCWAGDPAFVRYNLEYPLHPVRLVVTLARRLYFLFIANFHWIGTLAMVAAWRSSRIFRSRRWQVAWLMVAAHAVMLTLLGGAVLNRYLLPVLPIVFAAMAAAISLLPRAARITAACLLLAGVGASNWINPPYPFPFEDNLAYVDFVKLHSDAADYVQHWFLDPVVTTAWPMTAELSQPDLGFVQHGLRVAVLPNMAPRTLEALDWSKVQVLVVFSRDWDPSLNIMRLGPVLRFWERFYNFMPGSGAEEARLRIPFPAAAHFERRGQWVDVYVNPAMRLPAPHLARMAGVRTGAGW